jgi:hypothetical protein
VVVAIVVLAAWTPSAVAAPPTITPLVTGQPGDNGWYVGNVIVNWSITPPGYTVDFGCDPSTAITADTTGKKVACGASSGSDSASASVTIRLDKTPPSPAASADRGPDGGGFYNHPLTAIWTATDATSGVATCASAPYGGPDGAGIALFGTCRDNAGNVSAPLPFVFNYDATPPALSDVRATADSGRVMLAWQATGAARITVMRSAATARAAQSGVVYDGTGAGFTDTGLKNGTRYTYTVQAVDAAGNATSDSVNVTPGAEASSDRLLAPRASARLTRPPMLRWRTVKAASYYNIQLFRHGRKILSAWPTKAHYQLRSVWTYGGHRHRLGKATYQWYLWGGYGHRAERRYGKLLGKRSFVVA